MKKLLGELAFPAIAVAAAFLVGGLIVLAVGDNPFLVYDLFFTSAFSMRGEPLERMASL